MLRNAREDGDPYIYAYVLNEVLSLNAQELLGLPALWKRPDSPQ